MQESTDPGEQLQHKPVPVLTPEAQRMKAKILQGMMEDKIQEKNNSLFTVAACRELGQILAAGVSLYEWRKQEMLDAQLAAQLAAQQMETMQAAAQTEVKQEEARTEVEPESPQTEAKQEAPQIPRLYAAMYTEEQKAELLEIFKSGKQAFETRQKEMLEANALQTEANQALRNDGGHGQRPWP